MTEASSSLPEPKKDQYYEFKPFRVPKYAIKFQNARELSHVPGYVWYSPAPLFLWGRFEDKNLSDMVQGFGAKFFWYRFDFPVFSGLVSQQDSAWNHTLWAAEESQWPNIVDRVLETVQFDIPRKLLFQYALQSVEIADPLSLDLSRMLTARTPKVTVKLFAVQSNTRQYALDLAQPSLAQHNLAAVPVMKSFKPEQLHVDAARVLFANTRLTQDNAFTTYKGILRGHRK